MHIWTVMTEWIHQLTPWVGVGLAALESLFPPIPLTAVVAANVAAFGPVFGFLYSWIGSAFGSALVFFVIRAIATLPALRNLLGRDKLRKARGFVGPVLTHHVAVYALLLCEFCLRSQSLW